MQVIQRKFLKTLSMLPISTLNPICGSASQTNPLDVEKPRTRYSQQTESATRKQKSCVGLWLSHWPILAEDERCFPVPPFSFLISCLYPSISLPQLIDLIIRIHS